MSRQGKEPESQIVLKRPRREDRLAQHSSSTSIPSSIVPSFQGIDIVTAIRGVHDHMSTWMSSLIPKKDAVCATAALKEVLTICANRNLHQITGSRIAYRQMEVASSPIRKYKIYAGRRTSYCLTRPLISPLPMAKQSEWLVC